jgi:UDP-glucose:(heptosyl)LPS alpha-1,3-glucosyltransferase
VHFLLPAFARLRDPSARLMIVGNYGGQNQWAREMTGELGIAKRVIFAGSQKNVETFYAACDAFVFPSSYEASSLVLFEAFASGLPVIATRTGSAEDLIVDGENGFLLSPLENIDELSQKMETLFRDRSLGKRMGEKAREKANSYSWDRIAEQTMAVYKEVFDKEKRR